VLFDTTDKPSTPHRPDQRTPPMFFCERCETQFNATVAAASGDCPRCKEKEAISVPLRFRLFEPSAIRVAGLSPIRNGEPPARSHAAR
jgi:hypothetical protein